MPTKDNEQIDVRLKDALSDNTRRERRSLLLASFVSIIIAKVGLVPTEITNLGITFSDVDRSILLKAVGLVVGYFLVAFVIYGAQGWIALRNAEARVIQQHG